MTDRIQPRNANTNSHDSATFPDVEVTLDTDKNTLVVHDGATQGGYPLAREDGSNVTSFEVELDSSKAAFSVTGSSSTAKAALDATGASGFADSAAVRIPYDTALKGIDSGGNLINIIATAGTSEVFVGDPSTTVVFLSNGNVVSSGDNTDNLGSSSKRWKEVFSATGSINTSDEREKGQVRDISSTEASVAQALKGKVKAFKWSDAVTDKGSSEARWHFGVVAQEVAQVFQDHGLNANDYGLFC